LATNQIAQTGLSSLPPVIYYSEQLFRYLYDNKGLIDKSTSDDIINLQTFRNKIVHQVGIVSLSELELSENSTTLDSVIENLSSLKLEDITSKKGLNLRNTK
ncbi:hypothetical protein ACK3YB_15775, partial [Aeromonas caviae]